MPRLILPGSYQAVSTQFLPPDIVGLEYWGFFGASSTFSARNHAPGKSASSVVGSPTYSTNYATLLPGTNYIQTQASQSANLTIIAVARPLVDGYTYVASNNSGPTVTPPPATTRGATLRFETGAAADGKVSLAFNQSIKDGSNVDQEAAATKTLASNVNSFSFLMGRCDATSTVRTAKDFTTNLSQTATSAFTIDPGTNKFIVGGAQTVTGLFQNSVDIAMVAIYSTAKSDADVLAIYNAMKTYYASRSITI